MGQSGSCCCGLLTIRYDRIVARTWVASPAAGRSYLGRRASCVATPASGGFPSCGVGIIGAGGLLYSPTFVVYKGTIVFDLIYIVLSKLPS